MTMTNGLHDLIKEGADHEQINAQNFRDGMKPLRINGALKAAAGVTTIAEVLTVTPPIQRETRQDPDSEAS